MLKKILISLGILFLLSFAYYQFWFLRQPERTIPFNETTFLSPANGKVVGVTYWEQDTLEWQKDNGAVEVLTRNIDKSGWLIAIEMDVTHVHYQRLPVSSQLISKKYTTGKFKNALVQTNDYGFRFENERNSLLFETPNGLKYKVVQIAGLLARRIEDYVEPEENVTQGEIIGLIKLGSQVALVLPNTVEPTVEVGDIVTDGESVLARIKGK